MRSHSSLAIFAIDPSHRARPHCALSLATASASRSLKSHNDGEPMDVDVDPPVAILISSDEPSTWKASDLVPFPSDSEKSPRKHALLRSTLPPPVVTSILTNRKDRDASESLSPTAENQPPRKRTRTSALLQPLVKSQRSPFPSRSSTSRLPRSTSSLLFSGYPKQPSVPLKRAEEPFTYALPSSMHIMPPSPLLNLISSLITVGSLDHPTPQPSLLPRRRRKSFSGGTVLLHNVYKSVVRGLALKYSVMDFQVYQMSTGNLARSPFDIQDALLADRLRCHLMLQGEDINTLVSEIENPRTEISSSPLDLLPSGNGLENLSYERLVSSILLQRKSAGRSKTFRKGPERPGNRKPSKLAEILD